MDRTKQDQQAKLFTRDDVARIAVSTLNTVLEKANLQQIAQGIAVLPLGEGVYLIDVVMRDLATESTWAVSITIPHVSEETDGLT